MKKLEFIKESLKTIKNTGTLLPSSEFVATKMIESINFNFNLTILELGSGTGAITKSILKKMNQDSKLVCFEINRQFYLDLKKILNNDQRTLAINDSAKDMKKYLQEFHIKNIDYIISSIPLVTIGKKMTDNILSTSSELLNHHGSFIQLQYSKLLDRRLKKYFKHIDITFTSKNLFPAFVYNCNNK